MRVGITNLPPQLSPATRYTLFHPVQQPFCVRSWTCALELRRLFKRRSEGKESPASLPPSRTKLSSCFGVTRACDVICFKAQDLPTRLSNRYKPRQKTDYSILLPYSQTVSLNCICPICLVLA